MLTKQCIKNFWKYVTPGEKNECWIWQGYVNEKGDGEVFRDKNWNDHVRVAVRRVAYEIAHGEIEDKEMVVTYACSEKLCVNPTHLKLATRKETSWQGKKTHCKHGHKLPEPKQVGYRVIRACPICGRERQREYYQRNKELLAVS